jgi:hypothetical protein
MVRLREAILAVLEELAGGGVERDGDLLAGPVAGGPDRLRGSTRLARCSTAGSVRSWLGVPFAVVWPPLRGASWHPGVFRALQLNYWRGAGG